MPQVVGGGFPATDRKWILPLLASFVASFMLIMAATEGFKDPFYRIFNLGRSGFESRASTAVIKGPGRPAVLAYLISGSRGEGAQMRRLLSAVYHPRNHYLLQLDSQASDQERIQLALYVQSVRVFNVMNNVNVVGKADAVTYMGSTSIASTLHAGAVLLRLTNSWDWFVTLSAVDYPMITQD
ncbi:hypothetical protein KI387_010426, partial [Taxus chinensis]